MRVQTVLNTTSGDMMAFFRSLRLTNFLSFEDSGELDLRPLNLLIGANGSGKSNLLESIALLKATAVGGDLPQLINDGGGATEWRWKGAGKGANIGVDACVNYVPVKSPPGRTPLALRHLLTLSVSRSGFSVADEAIENKESQPPHDRPYFYFRYENGWPTLNVNPQTEQQNGPPVPGSSRRLQKEDLDPTKSVLSQRNDPDIYPELAYLRAQYERIALYTDWTLGRAARVRGPQSAAYREDRLQEDFLNLGHVIKRLQQGGLADALIEHLQRFSPTIRDVGV
ncbi:MAG: chromosome segregation protein SMC, partial [Dehalococcoidia bacterium]|nr:chromosome segregation protein SMC [Dehalococcoidia bacterium]